MTQQLMPQYRSGDRVILTSTDARATVLEEVWPTGNGIYFVQADDRATPLTMPTRLLQRVPEIEA